MDCKLFVVLILVSTCGIAQETDRMNKAELKEKIVQTEIKLKNVEVQLDAKIKEIYDLNTAIKNSQVLINSNEQERNQLKLLEIQLKSDIKALKGNEVLLSKAYDSLQKVNKELFAERDSLLTSANYSVSNGINSNLQGQFDSVKTVLKEGYDKEIKVLRDSLNYFSSSLSPRHTTYVKGKDFLNDYFFEQKPLMNNRFKFELEKIIINRTEIPEILDIHDFEFYDPLQCNCTKIDNEHIKLNRLILYQDLFKLFPSIEILKNKLFVLKYPNSKREESFLFNVFKNGTNNGRDVLEIQLANEEVNEDGTNNTAKDIVWGVYTIQAESYIALTVGQLHRIGIPIISLPNTNIQFRTSAVSYENCFNYNYYDEDFNGIYEDFNGIYEDFNGIDVDFILKSIIVTRKQDSYMNNLVSVGDVFLFKLKPLP
jgi:hypothetical protein